MAKITIGGMTLNEVSVVPHDCWVNESAEVDYVHIKTKVESVEQSLKVDISYEPIEIEDTPFDLTVMVIP